MRAEIELLCTTLSTDDFKGCLDGITVKETGLSSISQHSIGKCHSGIAKLTVGPHQYSRSRKNAHDGLVGFRQVWKLLVQPGGKSSGTGNTNCQHQ
jgi:hypothetical protein